VPVPGTLQVGTADAAQVEGVGPGTSLFNGAVSPDRTGRVAVLHYNVARADLRVQIHARSRRSTDAAGTMLGSQINLVPGIVSQGGFTTLTNDACFAESRGGTRCRWGDYASAVPDPSVDRVVWGTAMRVQDDRTYITNNFALTAAP
jgi:hypothetical protein